MLEILETETVLLEPWEKNPRINDQAVDAVARSISSFGFNVPILCDQNNKIIAGHTRWKAATQIGMLTVPVIRLQMTDAQRCAFAVADNKTAEIADWNLPLLREVIVELQSEDVDIGSIGFSDEELRNLMNDGEAEEDSLPEVGAEARTRPGEMIALGAHRLMCGDSKDSQSIERLTEGAQMDHVFGGPPYFNQRVYAQWSEYPEYISDMQAIVENCHGLLKDGSVIMWNIGNGSYTHHDHTGHHSELMEEAGLRYLDTIIWIKTGANFDIPRNAHIRHNRLYYPAFQWEALLVYQKPGDMPRMTPEGAKYMAESQTDVWEIPAVTHQIEQFGHPAVCPVEIPYRSIQAYSGENATVFEPFGGSGTTLIAAEKSGRRAFLMEMSPLYCDMIVKRWENLTGDKAKRLES